MSNRLDEPRLDDTRPRPVVNFPPPYAPRHELPAPPRFLLFGVIALFLLVIVGAIGGVVVFRSVLQPGQQERVIGVFPFMEAFLPPRPAAGDTLPTLEPRATGDISAQDLLNLSVGGGTATPAAAEPTLTPTLEPTVAPTLEPTAEPTIEPTTAPTLEPPAATAAGQTGSTGSETTPSDTLIATGGNTAAVSYSPAALLTGITYAKQTWNNCGPANATMALSYFGWQNTQDYAAQFLKPGGREDNNVSAAEIERFINEQSQVKAIYRMGGTLDLLKALLSNNIPVIIETGYYLEGSDWLGHYQTLIGYDDSLAQFIVNDSNIGPNHIETYSYLDQKWQHFNRTFIAIYLPQDEEKVARILGDRMDPVQAAQIAFDTAQAEARLDPTNAFAWFNMGTSLVGMGDYQLAAAAYDKALALGELPWRMLWYQPGPFEAYYNAGFYTDVVSLAGSNLSNNGRLVEETHYWLGMALAAEGKSQDAQSAFRQALRLNPQYEAAQLALDNLNRTQGQG